MSAVGLPACQPAAEARNIVKMGEDDAVDNSVKRFEPIRPHAQWESAMKEVRPLHVTEYKIGRTPTVFEWHQVCPGSQPSRNKSLNDRSKESTQYAWTPFHDINEQDFGFDHKRYMMNTDGQRIKEESESDDSEDDEESEHSEPSDMDIAAEESEDSAVEDSSDPDDDDSHERKKEKRLRKALKKRLNGIQVPDQEAADNVNAAMPGPTGTIQLAGENRAPRQSETFSPVDIEQTWRLENWDFLSKWFQRPQSVMTGMPMNHRNLPQNLFLLELTNHADKSCVAFSLHAILGDGGPVEPDVQQLAEVTIALQAPNGRLFHSYTFGWLINSAQGQTSCARSAYVLPLDRVDECRRPDNSVVVFCKITVSDGAKISQHPMANYVMPRVRVSHGYVAGIKRLLENEEATDLCIRHGHEYVKAHRAVFVARSPRFGESICIDDQDPREYIDFSDYFYTGMIDDEMNLTSDEAVDVLKFVMHYEVTELYGWAEQRAISMIKIDIPHFARMIEEFFFRNRLDIVKTIEWKSMKNVCYDSQNELMENVVLWAEAAYGSVSTTVTQTTMRKRRFSSAQ
ncbi:hypothetical protein QR680_000239 [Steinernema hermaphroditum]|uniref:BTB domain-containing protein n=1 Tax=Steinernema hermaphroditum TaxID=289476 RepID=A0AA39GTX4_9BILA|nr:hypothetical protein QR680_000239 [Steinernema hermaphroditum]